MNLVSWIHKLNESDSRLHKEDVIRQILEMAVLGNENCDLFLKCINKAYDPFIIFNLKQVPETVGLVGRENPWKDYMALLRDLESKNITGNNARDRVDELSTRFDSDQWNNFCRNVIRKDMRSGISEKTINKIVRGTEYEVPVFACQLATNCENRPEMKGIKRLEPKLDGCRVLMHVATWRITNNTTNEETLTCNIGCYSRNGKFFENFAHIEDQIKNNITDILGRLNDRRFKDGFWLDGEVTGQSFQELMRQARRKENVDANDSVFNIFDIVPFDQWEDGFWSVPLVSRIQFLENIRPVIDNMPNVELLPHITVNLDTGEGRDQLHRYANDMVIAGFEGIMIKDITSPYECKRNTNWMKWKPTHSYDLKVVGVEAGTGRNKDRLGALVCEGVDDGKHVKVNVGSGFTDSDRDSLWADHVEMDCVVGKTAEVLCDAITQNMDGTYSLRFPRFVRFRDDK
jgi:DNA ligase-1